MASPDAELKVRIDAELAAGFLTAFKTGAKIPKEFADKVDSELKRAAATAARTGAALGGSMVKGTNEAAFALTNLGRVAQDAPFGFIGIQNNINPLLESFQRLKAESGSTGSAIKLLIGSLTGAAGLGLAISLVTAALTVYTQYSQRAKKETEDTTESVKKQNEEFAKSRFTDASEKLQSLTNNIQLAKQGLLSKTDVLKQYNEGLGKTIGQVNSLDEAEQKLVDHGPAYLKLIQLKANADIAAKKAAEASFELAKKQSELNIGTAPKGLDLFRNRGQTDKKSPLLPTKEAIDSIIKNSGGAAQSIDGISRSMQGLTNKTIALSIANKQATDSLSKESVTASKVAQDAQQSLIDFSKQNGFKLDDLLGLGKGDGSKGIKSIDDILKELDTSFKVIDNNISTTFGDSSKKQIDAIQKAIDDLTKLGTKPAQEEIKTLQAVIGDFIPLEQVLNTQAGAIKKIGVTAKTVFDQFPTIDLNAKVKPIKKETLDATKTLNDYIGNQLLPKLQSGFENFFNDILEKGTFSFGALGQAILKTFQSVLASEVTQQILNLFDPRSSGKKKTVFDLIRGAASTAAPVAASASGAGGIAAAGAGVAATGGLLLPILGGLAAGALIASLFKKKSAPAPAVNATSTVSSVASNDFNSGTVVFQISGANLVGVLNRAGARLARYNI